MELSKRQEIITRSCGMAVAVIGVGAAAISAKFGIDVSLEESFTAIERNANDAEQAAAMLSFGASSLLAGMGLALATSPKK